MDQMIFIKNGEWMTIEGRVTAKGRTKDFMKIVGAGQTCQFFWPSEMGCAFVMPLIGEETILGAYLSPKLRLVGYKDLDTRQRRVYSLVWPHSYLLFYFRKRSLVRAHAVSTAAPLKSLSDFVGSLPMPNVSYEEYGHICIGDNRGIVHGSIMETAQQYMNAFLSRDFSSDMTEFSDYVPTDELKRVGAHTCTEFCEESSGNGDPTACLLQSWETISKKDPRAVLKLPWELDEWTLSEVISHMRGVDEDESPEDKPEEDVTGLLVRKLIQSTPRRR